MTYSEKPLHILQLFRDTFRAYPLILKNIWYLLIAFLLLQLIPLLLMRLNPYVAAAVGVLLSLANIFLFAVMLHLSHTALLGEKPSFRASLANAKKKYLNLLGGYIFFALIIALVVVVDFGIYSLGTWITNTASLIIIFIFSLFIYFLMIFALPLIILETKGIFKAFEHSVRLVWTDQWRIVTLMLVLFIIIFFIFLLGMSFTYEKNIFISNLWSMLVQFFAYPMLLSAVLILLNDSKNRQANE